MQTIESDLYNALQRQQEMLSPKNVLKSSGNSIVSKDHQMVNLASRFDRSPTKRYKEMMQATGPNAAKFLSP
jgi:hypothetical protein